VANLGQANPILGFHWPKFGKLWANCSLKLMLFVMTAPYQLVLNDCQSPHSNFSNPVYAVEQLHMCNFKSIICP
jgi:hypothetical protein